MAGRVGIIHGGISRGGFDIISDFISFIEAVSGSFGVFLSHESSFYCNSDNRREYNVSFVTVIDTSPKGE